MKKKYVLAIKFFTESKNEEQLNLSYDEIEKFKKYSYLEDNDDFLLKRDPKTNGIMVVLANKNEMVLLPLNEPTFGTKRKSQIQTYLEQNNGEGIIIIVLIIIIIVIIVVVIIIIIIVIIIRCTTYGSIYS
jgi:4-hydroxyphenylpyruvate dioxygenase-like putative hemolysin